MKSKHRHQRGHTATVNQDFILNNRATSALEDGYQISDDLVGEGRCGIVRSVRSWQTGRGYVIKTMVKADMKEQQQCVQEIELQARLDHPNILRIHEIFEDSEHVHLVLSECKGGDIVDLLDWHGQVHERHAQLIMKQVMCALCYMHSKHIAHRDLKLDNLLLKYKDVALEQNIVKVIDFGVASYFEAGSDSLRTVCGTPSYMAPEVLSGRYSEKCDSWSCGIMLYCLLSADLPFDGDSPQEILRAVRTCQLNFDDPAWSDVTTRAKLFVKQLCDRNPVERLSMTEALTSVWMQDATFKDATTHGTSSFEKNSAIDNLKLFTKKNPLEKLMLTCIAGMIEDSRIGALQKLFQELDTHSTGELSVKNLQNIGVKAGLKQASRELLDMDDDALIKYSEFLAANLNTAEHLQDADCWEAFRFLDTNGDGEITADELHRALSKHRIIDATQKEVEDIISRADIDGNNSLNFQEIQAALSSQRCV